MRRRRPAGVRLGASCLDIKRSDRFEVGKDVLVQKAHRVLAPQVTIEESPLTRR